MNSFGKKKTEITTYCLLVTQLQFLLLLWTSIAEFPHASHGCQEHERRALLELKSSLSDPSNRLSSWKEGSQHKNCCDWHGIECSSDSFHIVLIDLRNTGLENYALSYNKNYDPGAVFNPPNTELKGKLSSSLSKITHLEYLDLSLNNFQESQIPLQLSHLIKLTHLDLSYSNFSASISTQLTNLTSLRYLDLSCMEDYDYSYSCLEVSSTKWMRGLINLQHLSLSGIDLSKDTSSQKSFPEHISYLSNMKSLDISDCSISTSIFPIHDFRNLSHLSSLKMNYNDKLTSKIPVQIANLTSLLILDLSTCGLQGSIPYLPQLTELDVSQNSYVSLNLTKMFQHQWPKLQALSISDINIRGSIPRSISNAPLLVSLTAYHCSIQGSLPSTIYNLSQLQFLDLSLNNMTGHIHSSISNLTSLHNLDLSKNNFQGPIPKSFCQIVSLQNLRLNENNITGTIPGCISKLRNLKTFDVYENSIGGNISLISLINELDLTSIDLHSNRLTVVIDQNFSSYDPKFKLDKLVLPSCNLKGLFPTFICEMSNIFYLDLSHNHLTGFIPPCLSKLKNLQYFNFSDNKLHGPLPPLPFINHDVMSYKSSSYNPTIFDISNNKLSGEISIENGKRLSSFRYINLAQNELSGLIPFSICSFKSYPLHIDFSNNRLSGIIPTSIGYCSSLVSLNLGSNNLMGNVPNELQHALQLGYLQLNDNNHDGTVLDFISKLKDLRVLNLANNHFRGRIPATFGSLHVLRILSLRSNDFSGSIPEEIYHLKELQMLDLSRNNLTGFIPKEIGNLSMLVTRPSDEFLLVYDDIDVQLQMVIKGIMIQFEKLYAYSSGIDLSCNLVEGNIPEKIGLLKGLSTLNLSHNRFSGIIPQSVGKMSGLESLDLSFNKLSGNIPSSLASMNYLAYLNLSYNNLSGKIPREPHFDTLSGDGSAYLNNSLLCGFNTNHTCERDQRDNANSPNEGYEDDKEDAKERLLLYAIGALGFAVGFWGLFLALLLKKKKWWFGYWRLVDVVALRVANCLL